MLRAIDELPVSSW